MAKIITKKEYKNGERIKVSKVLPVSILENATQIDKIVSSGTFLRDEVREVTDYDPLPNGEGQQLIMTKNYEKVTKGGENENAES